VLLNIASSLVVRLTRGGADPVDFEEQKRFTTLLVLPF